MTATVTVWHIGNTTVRSPYRLKEAMEALKNSQFHGNLSSREQEEGFARLLNEKNIVRAGRLNRENQTDTSDLGRKWRSALTQLGFITYQSKKDQKRLPFMNTSVSGYPEMMGKPFEITVNGHRLIQSGNVAEMQEVFLRSLWAYRIPSVIERRYSPKFQPFSPLRFIIQILLTLQQQDTEVKITLEEMALIVQQRSPAHGIHSVTDEVLTYRKKRKDAPHKKKFVKEAFAAVAQDETEIQTWRDYADLNFRYLKATGLFQGKGRGITLLPEKETLIRLLPAMEHQEDSGFQYLEELWNGARLPTDDKIKAVEILQNLYQQLHEQGESIEDISFAQLTESELTRYRYQWQERLMHLKEEKFAADQAGLRPDIAALMKTFLSDGSRRVITGLDGDEISVPAMEAPAYFEWIIWRGFLAIGGIENPPWQSRNFSIDQDFLPLSHAPAGRPDLIFHFDEFVLIVEVTLTRSSRQEAAEGEPVRRHVARIAEEMEHTGKRVFCLFIAPTIDSNTAETFKIGTWYKKDETRLPLHIVPVTLADFIDFFQSVDSDWPDMTPADLMKLLIICRSLSNCDAPQWKKEIHKEFTMRRVSPIVGP